MRHLPSGPKAAAVLTVIGSIVTLLLETAPKLRF